MNRKEYKELRMEVLSRDEYTCLRCGVPIELGVGKNAVHHLISNKDIKENLITLCPQCHGAVHKIPAEERLKNTTTIEIHKTTRERLKEVARKSETYDQAINRILDEREE